MNNGQLQAALDYKPDTLSMSFHSKAQGINYDDSQAEKEWGWKVEYSLERMIADFYEELRKNPDRYR